MAQLTDVGDVLEELGVCRDSDEKLELRVRGSQPQEANKA